MIKVSTRQDRDTLLAEIESIKRFDYRMVRKWLWDIIEPLKDNKEVLDKLLSDLEKELSSVEEIKITLAIEPTVGILEEFDNFFNSIFKKKFVYDFEVDKSLIGGLKIVYEGKYFESVLK